MNIVTLYININKEKYTINEYNYTRAIIVQCTTGIQWYKK